MLMVIGDDLHLELASSTFTVDAPRPDRPNLGTHTYQSVFWNICQIPKFLAVLKISQNNTTGHQRLTKLLSLKCILISRELKSIVSRLLAGYKRPVRTVVSQRTLISSISHLGMTGLFFQPSRKLSGVTPSPEGLA